MIGNKTAKYLSVDYPKNSLALAFYEKSKAARKHFVLYVVVTGYISFHFLIMYYLRRK